jgi:hypothetical protein
MVRTLDLESTLESPEMPLTLRKCHLLQGNATYSKEMDPLLSGSMPS